jgi:hypothetical protein
MTTLAITTLRAMLTEGKTPVQIRQTLEEYSQAQQILQIISGHTKVARLRILELAQLAAKNDEVDSVWPVEERATQMLAFVNAPDSTWASWQYEKNEEDLHACLDTWQDAVDFYAEQIAAGRTMVDCANRDLTMGLELVAPGTKTKRGRSLTALIFDHIARYYKMVRWNQAHPEKLLNEPFKF